jgi:hypothetical protein
MTYFCVAFSLLALSRRAGESLFVMRRKRDEKAHPGISALRVPSLRPILEGRLDRPSMA